MIRGTFELLPCTASGMAPVAGDFCIQEETPYAKGNSWHEALEQCHADDLRC